jgi:site-specific DNA-cytosine methylase
MKPKILIACEESDQVRSRYEKMGFDAWSCDIQPNRTNTKKHLQIDLIKILNHNWDAIIAFPPCTHLSVAGSRYFAAKKADGRQQEAINFFMQIAENKCKFIAIENPLGIMSTIWRKPDQIIHPYYFGDETLKRTCLWL